MEIKQLLFLLINSEIFSTTLPAEIGELLSEQSILELLNLSAKHDLSHIVISAISKLGVLSTDEWSDELRSVLLLTVYRDGQKEHAIKETSRILETKEIPYLPLKGAVIRDLYPESWMRTSCDIDILIHKEDAEKAINALCQAGFNRQQDQTKHDYALKTPGDVLLELHYVLSAQGYISKTNEILDAVWEYAEPLPNSYRYSMSNEMLIFYHIAHMAKHFTNGGCGIRPYIDLFLLHTKVPFVLSALENMLKSAQLKEFYDFSIKLCNVWFNKGEHNQITEKMEQYILTGGVYGTIENHAKIQEARGENKVKHFFELIFLSYSRMVILYPQVKKYPILFPIYQIKRWFSMLNKEKRHKAKHIIEVRNNVAQEEIDSVKKMLFHLGLGD